MDHKIRGVAFGEFLAALVLAIAVAAFVLPPYLRARERTAVALAQDRMRTTAVAIGAYFVDHQTYPACAAAVGQDRFYEAQQIWMPKEIARIPGGVPTINSFAPKNSGAARLVTFRIAAGPSYGEYRAPNLATLTTPVAYLDHFLADPFAYTRNASLGYFAQGDHNGWILFSLGPDRDENDPNGPGDISPRVERLYDVTRDFPGMWTPSAPLIEAGYDPTNGLMSNGDLYWLGGK